VVAGQAFAKSHGKRKVLVVFSDMRQFTRDSVPEKSDLTPDALEPEPPETGYSTITAREAGVGVGCGWAGFGFGVVGACGGLKSCTKSMFALT